VNDNDAEDTPAYKSEEDSSFAKTPGTIKEVVDHPPSLWIGFTKSGDTDTANNYKAYAIDSIEYRYVTLDNRTLITAM
jgi:hypothetical protein